MNILKNLFLFNKKSEKNKEFSPELVDQSLEIAKLVKEARIQQNLTIKELSYISKIPERIISSIENNNKSTRPEYPFIRSNLLKIKSFFSFLYISFSLVANFTNVFFFNTKHSSNLIKIDLIKGYSGLVLLLLFSIEFIIRSGIFEMYDNSLIERFC